MPEIYQCELVSPECPPIEPIEAPLPFENIEHFESWLRGRYIPRTMNMRLVPLNPSYDIDINKTECWAIFSSDGLFERSYQVYPKTHLSPEFEELLRGKILSHNHFSDDSTLSPSDVVTWAYSQMKEIRAVTQSKTYSIKTIDQNWPNPRKLAYIFSELPPSMNSAELHSFLDFLSKKELFEYSVMDLSK